MTPGGTDETADQPRAAPGAKGRDASGEPNLEQRIRQALADRYDIQHEIGSGGMGTVYLARDLKLHRAVAVKVLHQHISAALGPERFRLEIEVTARLQHPNILPLFDSGSSENLHYYITPFIDGESLQQRLRRTPQLRISEALRIARGIAAGLDAAHAQSILHRDIKPANILLSGDQVVIADFGLARVLDQADREALTTTGMAVGTPEYMSPEQASAGPVGRGTDIYALGCVVYEMLSGEPPFTGASRQAVIMKHIAEPPPSLSVLRPGAPGSFGSAIRTALEKSSADRFETAGEFIRALEEGSRWSPLRVIGAIMAVAAVLALALVGVPAITGGKSAPPADTTQYVVLPFRHQDGASELLEESYLLQDALARWRGLTVIDPIRVRGAVPADGERSLSSEAAAGIARRLGAGRYFWGEVSQDGDALRVQAALYDADHGGRLADHTFRLPGSLAGADSLFAEAVNILLFRGSPPDDAPSVEGTRSLPARQAFDRGQRALAQWNLAEADSAFTASATWDEGYSRALLWIALVRSWSGAERPRWVIAAEQAAMGRERLIEADRSTIDAVLAEARADLGRACPLWYRNTEHAPRDFAAWYGLARCLARDDAVLPDRSSPSGWRFRTSYHGALLAYRRAFALRPAILTAFRGSSYELLRDLFMTGGNERRAGRTLPPDTMEFLADPIWQGDSLALVPYPADLVQANWLAARPSEQNEAVRHLRQFFHDVALSWVASSPESCNAMEALAIALGLLGDPAALDTLARARALARDPAEQPRLAVAEVWMQLAFALPWDPAGLARARELADSLLRQHAPARTSDPWLFAGLAALTGQVDLAAAYARETGVVGDLGTPPPLQGIAPALLVYSAFGGPKDSLAILEQRVTAAVEDLVTERERPAARMVWLAWPATMAYPTYEFAAVKALSGQGDFLLDLQAHWAAGDTLAVRTGLDSLWGVLQQFLPANRTLDALYPEAELLVAIGDFQGAADWLDPTLRALPQIAQHLLTSPLRAASLVRAAGLRARLAERLGDDDGARRWAGAVVTLWSDADPLLQPVVAEMRRLANQAMR